MKYKPIIIKEKDINHRSVLKQIMDVTCSPKVFKSKKAYNRKQKPDFEF